MRQRGMVGGNARNDRCGRCNGRCNGGGARALCFWSCNRSCNRGRLSRRRTAKLTVLAPWHTPPSLAAAGWWSRQPVDSSCSGLGPAPTRPLRPHTDCPGRCHAPDTAVEPWRAVRDGKQGVLGWLSALSGAFLARWARFEVGRSLEVYISIKIGYWPSPHDLWGSTETTGGHLRRRSGPPREILGV